MDQALAKQTLQALIKREDLNNKVCIDCSNPNPQWASLSFAVFLCLQCAGTHRGFGVHISFVRSVSMDTWHEDQIKRMTLGGNGPFQTFMESYTPAEQGGYKLASIPYEKYHCWAATQYRSKLDADLAGKPWSPSAPPVGVDGTATPPGRPSSAQGLRKARTTTMRSTSDRFRSEHSPSPASLTNSVKSSPMTSPQLDQKSANESYFASLGHANAFRSEDLPPSQGGKYQGFGNTPSPDSGAEHPSYGLSSRAAPTLSDLQENPVAALSKGWSIFSAAVSGATRAVNDNVIQPGVERVMDPTLQANLRGYVSDAGKRAGDLGKSANQWSKAQFGVDVADQVGGVVGTVKEKIGAGPTRDGYGALPVEHFHDGESSALYRDDDDEFFREHTESLHQQTANQPTSQLSTGKGKKEDWDDWKDF